MPVTVWNCHLALGCGERFISQSRFGCQVVCTDIQGISAQLPGGSICQSMFICQVWCSGIQGIYSWFRGGSICQSVFFLPSVVYWCSRLLCSICGGSICQSVFVCQVLCTGIQSMYAQFIWGDPSARWSAYMSSNSKHPKLPFSSTGKSMGVHLPK